MGNHKNRRSQTPKARNEGWMRAEQDRARSSVAEPHRNRKKYSRTDRRDRSWAKDY